MDLTVPKSSHRPLRQRAAHDPPARCQVGAGNAHGTELL